MRVSHVARSKLEDARFPRHSEDTAWPGDDNAPPVRRGRKTSRSNLLPGLKKTLWLRT
jgi:hypothetical protein